MNFIKYRYVFFTITAILIIASFACIIMFGLKPGIEFTGGSIMEATYQANRPSNQEIQNLLNDLNLGETNIQPSGAKDVIFRMKDIDETVHQQILQKLGGSTVVAEKSFESIGPVIGKELKGKTNVIMVVSLLAIAIYISIAFVKVQKPVRPWHYSLTSFFVLAHDILIPFGVFAILGKYYGVQITIPVIVALLTVIGYAINNVVVVFDRMREHILSRHYFAKDEDSFLNLANVSINQTLGRQINTSVATLFPLLAMYFFGGEVLKNFALALILGISAGLYSSIFLAIPIVYEWLRMRKRV